MRVRVFGTSSDDKGKQLEILTQRLLVGMGYRQVTLNKIRTGGTEIDVTGEFPVPGFDGTRVTRMFCECKALEAPLNSSDWQKFLGKYFLEHLSDSSVQGVMISLSGVNGNVSGQYDELARKDVRIELLDGDRLVKKILSEFKLPDTLALYAAIERLTSDPVATVSLGYREALAFWIVEFANSTFTVLYGETLDQSPSGDLVQLIAEQIQAARYRDLSEENLAKTRSALARKIVLGQLLSDDNIEVPQGIEASLQPQLVPTRDELDGACCALAYEGVVIAEQNRTRLADLASNVVLRANVLREILAPPMLVQPTTTPRWISLIDDDLLNESLRVKDQLQIKQESRAKFVMLLKWSPSGLYWALNPDPLLCGHRGNDAIRDPIFMRDHALIYETELFTHAVNDFRAGVFAHGLLESHGLRELEFQRRAKFKSKVGVQLDMEIIDRTGIARGAADLNHQVVTFLMSQGQPEPWERGV
jgi:hypothetical protein